MKKFLKIVRRLLLLMVVIGGVLVAFNWSTVVQIARFSPVILPPMYGSPQTEAEAHSQDLRFLRKLTRIDRSFTDEARGEFERLLDKYDAQTGEMDKASLYLAVSRLSALADNGHTGISVSPLYKEFNRIGAKLYWFSDGLYIVRAARDKEGLVGARIVAIEGTDVSDVQATLDQYFGGVSQRRRLYGVFMIESPEIMHAVGLAPSPERLTMSIKHRDGETQEIVFDGKKSPGQEQLPARSPWMTLKPVPLPDEDDEWHRALALPEDKLPLYLRDSNNRHFTAPLKDGLYIRTQLTLDSPQATLESLLSEAISPYREDKLNFLVVDLRWNPGGDYTKVLDFAKQANDVVRDDGRIYIVVGPQTFSAALVTAALLKYYGSEKSMIVGQPMGDREQFWAERGMRFVLPNSKYPINYATGYHDWEEGCEGHEYCFSQNLIHQVPAGSLVPEKLIDPTYDSYASGRDEILQWIRSRHE